MGRARAEGRHRPAPGAWEERWWFDFTAGAAGAAGEAGASGPPWGGYVRLAFRPFEGVAWYWAAVVGADLHPLVAFRAHDVAIPSTGTEIRARGVWAALTCETPGEHWSLGLECFGVALDDPLEAWAEERGDVIPFGLDLEWEATAAAVDYANDGYDQWCEVHGDVLIGDYRLEVDGRGSREHAWGAPEAPPRCRVAVPGRPVARPLDPATTTDVNGLPIRARVDDLELDVLHRSPVAVPDSVVVHALVDTPEGAGWVTWWE